MKFKRLICKVFGVSALMVMPLMAGAQMASGRPITIVAPFVAGSIAGTVVGGGATVGTAQLAYSSGLSAWWFTLGSGIGLLILAAFYAKPLRNSGLETIPQFLVFYYGQTSGPLTSFVSSAGIFFSIAASLLSTAATPPTRRCSPAISSRLSRATTTSCRLPARASA